MRYILYFFSFLYAYLAHNYVYADELLKSVIKSENRTPEYVLRDKFRNPEIWKKDGDNWELKTQVS